MGFSLAGLGGSILNGIGNIGSAVVGGLFSSRNTDKTNQANKDITEQTNQTNKEIAEQNLGFQRENLDYQKALQQQIFNREDTAYQRTVNDMRAAGISPLAMQGTNGAGEVISTTPMNNDYQAQGYTAMRNDYDLGSSLNSAVNSMFNNAQTASQLAMTKEQVKSMEIDNQLKSLTFFDKVLESGLNLDKLRIDLARSRSEHSYESMYGLNRSMSPAERNVSMLFNLLGNSPFSSVSGSGDSAYNVYSRPNQQSFDVFMNQLKEKFNTFSADDVLSTAGSVVQKLQDDAVEKVGKKLHMNVEETGSDWKHWKLDPKFREETLEKFKNSWFNKIFRMVK